jgi:hypothetical protein
MLLQRRYKNLPPFILVHEPSEQRKKHTVTKQLHLPIILIIFPKSQNSCSYSQLFKMKQSIIVSILSMAMAVSAVPTSLSPTNNGNVNQCSGGNNKQVCCNNGLLGLLTCSVQVLGGACDGSVTCCNTQAAEVSCFFPTRSLTILSFFTSNHVSWLSCLVHFAQPILIYICNRAF